MENSAEPYDGCFLAGVKGLVTGEPALPLESPPIKFNTNYQCNMPNCPAIGQVALSSEGLKPKPIVEAPCVFSENWRAAGLNVDIP